MYLLWTLVQAFDFIHKHFSYNAISIMCIRNEKNKLRLLFKVINLCIKCIESTIKCITYTECKCESTLRTTTHKLPAFIHQHR